MSVDQSNPYSYTTAVPIPGVQQATDATFQSNDIQSPSPQHLPQPSVHISVPASTSSAAAAPITTVPVNAGPHYSSMPYLYRDYYNPCYCYMHDGGRICGPNCVRNYAQAGYLPVVLPMPVRM